MARVLVIDDDQDIAKATAMMLEAGGHKAEIELNEKKAVERVGQVKPDVVVLDVMFPGNDTAGFELARDIHSKYEKLPIVMVTSVNEHGKLGFSGADVDPSWLPVSEFIEKPVKKERLLELVRKFTAK
ncbi:MAG: response regulator [Elusimicrobiota bacterium]|jgi:CheY-like chemotaxis protein